MIVWSGGLGVSRGVCLGSVIREREREKKKPYDQKRAIRRQNAVQLFMRTM